MSRTIQLHTGNQGLITLATSASFAATASYAATASNLTGGTTNYIPLWTSTTAQSSSAISQNAGNIGINVAPANIQARLHVSGGNIQLDNNTGLRILDNAGTAESVTSLSTANNLSLTSPTVGGSIIYSVRNSAGAHQFFIGGIEYARIASSGNVGIGTTSPPSPLTVLGNISGSAAIDSRGSQGRVIIQNSAGGAITLYSGSTSVGSILASSVGGGLAINDTNNYNIRFTAQAATLDTVFISSSGNVGIGTIDPRATLHIQGNVSASSYTSSISNGVGYFGTSSFAVSASWAPSAVVSTYTNATDNRVLTSTGVGGINGESTLTYDGTVLSISTNNARYFQGGDDAALYDVNVVNTLGVYGVQDSTVGAIKLGSSGQTLYSNATGVGIGTTTPGATLHIQGAISGSTMTLTGTATVQSLVETSTQELKKNITPMESTITTLYKLEPSRFNWISTDEPDIGLIAEQVEQIFPELVTHDADGKLIGVKYSKLTVLLLKAVQEMSQRIESLEQQSIYKRTH
jgi:hypothetical protein